MIQIIERNISELIAAEYNPRKITPTQMEHLKESLSNFECLEPAIININPERHNIVVGGHQRLKAAKALGWDKFPCVEVDLNYDQEREANIRLNKNGGEFDFEMLEEYFETDELLGYGFEKEELTFDMDADFLEEVDLPELATGDKAEYCQQTYTLHDDQATIIKDAIDEYKKTDGYKYLETFGNESSNGNALYGIVQEWLAQKK